jgi:oligopeptide transport system substrate-binding protein
MFKKRLAVILSLAMVVTTFAGCGNKNNDSAKEDSPKNNVEEKENDKKEEEEKKEDKEEKQEKEAVQELEWNLGTDPKYLDPGLNSASDGGDVVNNLFEGLVREFDGVYEPAIAEKWDISDDGLTYTFHLRESKWSDGKALTAKDFEYAWKRVLDPETKSEYAFIMYAIKNAEEFNKAKGATIDDVGIKAEDDSTLKVTLKSPTPYFLGLTQFYTYFPTRQDAVESGEDGIWAKKADKFVSNGPFKLTEYTSGDKIVMEKNENYWNADNVKLDKITASMIVEASTSMTAYEKGDIDVIDDVPTEEIARVMAEDPTFNLIPTVGTYYYNLNMDEPILQDVKVRMALSLAIDRKSIVDNVTKGGQLPGVGFVPPGLLDAEGNDFREVAGSYYIPTDGSKIDEAKKLLEEAGYPNGEGFPTLELKYNTSESHKKVAEAVQDAWKKNLNINVKLSNAEWAVFQTQKIEGDYQIARGGWLGDYADPNTMLDLFVIDGSHNDPNWVSEEYTKLIKDASMMSGQERMEKFYEAEKILMDACPIIPVYFYTDIYMVNENAEGVIKTKLNTFYFGNVEMK